MADAGEELAAGLNVDLLNTAAAARSPVAEFTERNQAPLSCAVSVCLLAALHHLHGVTDILYDAADYWHLARPDVFGMTRTNRGYLFPALMLPLHWLASVTGLSSLDFLKLGLILAYGIALPLVVPALFVRAFGGKLGFWRRLVPVVLMAQLFPGVLIYPLSDLPALLMLMGGVLCLLIALQGNAPSRGRFLFWMFLGGLLLAGAYNTRTIYMFGLAGTAAVLALKIGFARPSPYPRVLALAAFALGALVISLPQLVINQRTHGVSKLGVVANVKNYSLFASQLAWGMTLQRYETSVPGTAPSPGVYYIDPAGAELFDFEIQRRNPFLLRDYVAIVLLHPLDFFALYTRHFINGLDVRDGIVYTSKPSPRRDRTAVFNFCVLALSCWLIFAVARHRRAAEDMPAPRAGWPFALAILLLPVAAIIPGAIETRFFLPLHVLAYGAIAFYFDQRVLGASLRRDAATVLVFGTLAASIFFGVTFATMATQEYAWPPLYQFGPPR